MELWRKISLVGILLGNIALLVDYFLISVPHIIMIPLLIVSIILRPRWHCQHTPEQSDFAHAKSFVLCSFQPTKSGVHIVYSAVHADA